MGTVREEVFTEVTEVSGMDPQDVDTAAILAKMGGKAGTFTETLPDGTTVTYEIDMEEEEASNHDIYQTAHYRVLRRNLRKSMK